MAFDISFVALAWNSELYVRRCLDSVLTQCAAEGLRAEFIVVDNGSRDRSPEVVREYAARGGDQVRLIALDRNRGTTYPRNVALKTVRSPVVCILDSDTEYRSGSFRRVIGLLAAHAEIGIVAPRLVLSDGTVQHSVKHLPTLLDKLRKVPRILTGRKATHGDFYGSFPFDRPTLVESAISACWVLRADLLGEVGLLDEGIFYSPEDLDYSARVREAGRQILYDPGLTLVHHTQQVSHHHPVSMLALAHFRGLFRFYCRHGGWFVRRDGEAVPWTAGDSPPSPVGPDQGPASTS